MKQFNCETCGETNTDNFYPNYKSKCKTCVIKHTIDRREGRKLVTTTPGLIYIVSNVAYPGYLKVGRTTDMKRRLSGYNTGDPHKGFVVEYQSETFLDAISQESKVFNKLTELCFEMKGEWAKADLDEIMFIIERLLISPTIV